MAQESLRVAGLIGLAALLYAAVAATVVETFVAASQARWLVLIAGALYAAATYLAWRQLRWTTRAAASFFLLWLLLGASLYLGPGFELVLGGQTTPTLLSVFTLGAVALAGLLLVLAGSLPTWARVVAGLLAVYGVVAFGLGVADGTPYAGLLHGAGLGPPKPVQWLGGAILGALAVVPAALVWELYRGAARVRGSALRPWAMRAATLLCSLALAVFTVTRLEAPAPPQVASAPSGAVTDAPEAPAPPPEEPAPPAKPVEQLGFTPVSDFSVPSVRDDSMIHLADYHQGKVVLVNWARSDCGWSKDQAPKLAARYAKWKDRGLEIVEVLDEFASSMDSLEEFIAPPELAWPIGLYDQAEFAREIRPMGSGATPETYLISRRGKIEYVGLDRGDEYWQKLDAAVEKALAEPPPSRVYVRPRPLEPAPPFELEALDGRRVRLSDFAGKPLVVEFFHKASCDWTGPLLAELHDEYGPRGVEFVAVNLFDEDGEVRACLEKRGTRYTVLRGTPEVQQAWTGGSKGWAVFFVTPDQRLFKTILDGYGSDGNEAVAFRELIDALVSGSYRTASGGGGAS